MRPATRFMNSTTLAINGGDAVFPSGPPTWPKPDAAVEAAVAAALTSGDWGRYHGENTELAVEQLGAMHGLKHVQLCCSGTIGVELALRGLQVGPGDEVLLAGYDFPGNFRAIEATGAMPVLMDIDPTRWTLSPDRLEEAIGPKVKAAVVSHLHGGVADMQAICAAVQQHGVRVVEDVCQAPGALVQGQIAGSWGDVAVLSFGGSKLLTAGRGGAVLSNDDQLMQRITIFRERGNDAFAMSELQAAVLPPQLSQLAQRNEQRQRAVARLLSRIADIECLTPVAPTPDSSGVYYKLAFLYHVDRCGDVPRERFAAACRAEGVALDAGFRGFAGRSARRCRKPMNLPASRNAAESTLILHHPLLIEDDDTLDLAAAALHKVVCGLCE